MMSALIQCILSMNCSGFQIINLVLDIMAPIVLEIIFIGLVFDHLIDIREKRRWSLAKFILFSRLIRIQDELLLDLVPATERKASLTNIKCGPIVVDMLFDWKQHSPDFVSLRKSLTPYIDLRSMFLISKISTEREKINQILQAHSAHIEPELFGILLEIDSNLSRAETIGSFTDHNEVEFADAIYTIILAVVNLRKWLLQSKEIILVP